jgi:hypothetical protein
MYQKKSMKILLSILLITLIHLSVQGQAIVVTDIAETPSQPALPDNDLSAAPVNWSSYHKTYRAYANDRRKINTRERNIMAAYANVSSNDKSIEALGKKWLKNDIALNKLNRKYYRKFRRATSATVASRYFLGENQRKLSEDVVQ